MTELSVNNLGTACQCYSSARQYPCPHWAAGRRLIRLRRRDALWEVLPCDAHGNVSTGQTLPIDTRDSSLFSERCLLTPVGVDNIEMTSRGLKIPMDVLRVGNKYGEEWASRLE